MRVLTVRQPWATAIVGMGKDVENRTRNIAGGYRGPVAIHAGLAMPPGRRGTRTSFEPAGEVEHDLSGLLLRSPKLAWPYRLPLGVVIGVVDLIGVHEYEDDEYAWISKVANVLPCSSWAERGPVHHLELANPRPLPEPIPARGRLGLWTPDDALANAIRAQLAEVS